MPPSYDPELRLIYQGTSVTLPAPKFRLGGVDNTHLYHNCTLALNVDTGEIVGYYQHLNDTWDLDHPFERLLLDTAVAPNPDAVSWINPRLQPGEVRKVMTGIPGKTGVVYTLDRETGEFLWATPTIAQNVINDIDGATGAVTENAEVVFSAGGQQVLACPNMHGGKDWETGETTWLHEQRAATLSLVATGGGLVTGQWLSDQLRGGRTAVRRRQHRRGRDDTQLPAANARASPEHWQQSLRVRLAGLGRAGYFPAAAALSSARAPARIPSME